MTSTKNEIIDNLKSIGGKAANLNYLNSIGVAIPQFHTIDGTIFSSFIEEHKKELIAVVGSFSIAKDRELFAISKKIQKILNSSENKKVYKDMISDQISTMDIHTLYAVRSSGSWEDSKNQSFAGIFNTYLNIPKSEIAHAVLRCWIESFNPQFLIYCSRNSLNPLQLNLAVIIQKMVQSVKSGIIFTADPRGNCNEMVIVAGYGLGEGIVADQVETDTYRIKKTDGTIVHSIGEKKTSLVLNIMSGKGIGKKSVPPTLRKKAVLDDEMIMTIFSESLKIEAYFNSFQDIEWGIDNMGKLFFFQTRPITTLPSGDLSFFDNSNIVESYPGVTLPLTFSIVKKIYEKNFMRMSYKLGVSRKVLTENQHLFDNMVGYIEGRTYYNMTSWYSIMSLASGLGKRLPLMFNQMIGAGSEKIQEKRFSLNSLKELISFLIIISRIVFRFFTINLSMKLYKKKFDKIYKEQSNIDLTSTSAKNILSAFQNFFNDYLYFVYVPLINDFLLMIFSSVPRVFLKRYGIEDSDNIFNSLMCGEEDMESVFPIRSLVDAAVLVRNNKNLKGRLQKVLSGSDKEKKLRELINDSEFEAFGNAFRKHITLYGDRNTEELKLEVPSFRENPLLLVQTILRYVPLSVTVENMIENEMKQRHGAEMIIRKALRFHPLKKLLLTYLINKSRELIKNRELARLDRARFFGQLRTFLNALGRSFTGNGIFLAPDDIYFLTRDEISAIIYGNLFKSNIKKIIKERKITIKIYESKNPDDQIVFRGTICENKIPQKKNIEKKENTDKILSGYSCSPGRIVATAIVVDNVKDVPDVSGKIIVATMTDPGWVFLIASSAGLIVEKGSLLSHTAIIGRELGIPTVVGVKNATEIISSGDKIELNASEGSIMIL